MKINSIIQGNTLEQLKKLPSESIDTIITSPPYWGLRDYGEDTKTIWDGDKNCKHIWKPKTYTIGNKAGNKDKSLWFDGKPRNNIKESNKARTQTTYFCQKCGAWYGQLGLEPTLDLYIEHLLQITAELKRVLKKTGVMFWDHGDCYGGSGMGTWKNPPEKIKSKEVYHIPYGSNVPTRKNREMAKCLMGQNYRLILRMVDEQNWVWRNTIIWQKPNHMPSSVKDRFANAYEPVFFLTKNKKYYFDLDAVRQPLKQVSIERMQRGVSDHHKYSEGAPGQTLHSGINKPRLNVKFNYRVRDAEKKSKQCPQFKASKEEIERYKRQTKIPKEQAESFGSPRAIYHRYTSDYIAPIGPKMGKDRNRQEWASRTPNWSNIKGKNPGDVWKIATQPCPKEYRGKHFAMFPEKLVEPMILAGCPKNGIVLDPFCGLATTGVVAKKLGRNFIGIEISKEYCKMANERFKKTVRQEELLSN